MALKTTPFDAAEYLDTPESQAELLTEAFQSGDANFIKNALATVARAKGVREIAETADLSRQGIYKSLSDKGDPKLSTLMGIIGGMGMSISVSPTPTSD